MKKILLTIIAIIIVTILRANPISLPSVVLSELIFETNGKWVIELQYLDANVNMPIDSIWIRTSSGIAKVRRFKIIGDSGVIIIRNDSLLSNLILNPLNDSIQIIYKLQTHTITNAALVYGSLPNSTVNSPRTGQSIAGVPPYFNSYSNQGIYCIDKSPTIGTINDSIGMCGTIKGHIFDKNGNLLSITVGGFYNVQSDINIHTKPDGSYYTRLYSWKNHIDKLLYYQPITGYKDITIAPIDVNMQPDSVVNVDIHIIDSITVGLIEIIRFTESIIKIYPNPLSGLILNYVISLPVKSSNCIIRLVNINGQKIAEFHVTDNSGIINLPSNIKNGSYTVLLFVNDKNYSSSPILIAR
jgi:hypothetical protein